mgnify:CR=1 FL=1
MESQKCLAEWHASQTGEHPDFDQALQVHLLCNV